MLALTISSRPLDLYPDSSASITLLSAYFDRDRIERAFSYPLTIPATPRNLSLLEYPNRLDAKKKRKFENARLLINDLEFEKGVIVITDVSNESIEIAFQNDSLDTSEKMKLVNMQDITDEYTATDPYQPDIYLVVPADPATDASKTCYLEINGVFFDRPMVSRTAIVTEINTEFPGLCTLDADSSERMQIILSASVKPDLQIRLRPPNPGPMADYVPFELESITNTAEQDYEADWIAHLDAIVASPGTHVFPTIYAPDLYDGNVADYEGYINYYNTSGDYGTNDDYFSTDSWKYPIVPMMFLKSAVEKAMALVGVSTVQGDFFNDSDIQKLIVYNQKTLDQNINPQNFVIDADQLYDNQLFNPWNGWKSTYNLGDHLPNVSVYEFMNRLGSTFPLITRIRNGVAKINSVNALLGQKPTDLTDYITENFAKEYSEATGYKLTYDRQDEDVLSDTDLLDLQDGNDDDDLVEIEAGFFSLYNKTAVNVEGTTERFWLLPQETGQCTSDLAETVADIPFKLLWYFGLQDDNVDNDYPFASFFPENYDGTSVGAYSLQWDGTEGLYAKWWSKLIKLLQSDIVEITLYLPMYKLMELRDKITAPVVFRHPHGSMKGVIRELKFEITLEPQELIRVDATIVKF